MSDQVTETPTGGDFRRPTGFRERSERPSYGGRRKFFRRKVCKICIGKSHADYKDPEALRRFTTDRGKILPRRITGTCAKHQRLVSRQIKRARTLALLPFATK